MKDAPLAQNACLLHLTSQRTCTSCCVRKNCRCSACSYVFCTIVYTAGQRTGPRGIVASVARSAASSATVQGGGASWNGSAWLPAT